MSEEEKTKSDLKEYLLRRRRAITEDEMEANLGSDSMTTGYYLAYGEILKKFCGITGQELFQITLKDREEILKLRSDETNGA
jgi:hypothetical protein